MAIVIPVKDLAKHLPRLLQKALTTDAKQGSGQEAGNAAGEVFSSLGVLLRSQAVRRIKNGGDPGDPYPDLWANTKPGHRRFGGSPLQDTGALMASLSSETSVSGNRITLSLKDGSPGGYGVYHQAGFTKSGVTNKGRAWTSVTPQRKIFNLPPFDRMELGEAIVNAITKMR